MAMSLVGLSFILVHLAIWTVNSPFTEILTNDHRRENIFIICLKPTQIRNQTKYMLTAWSCTNSCSVIKCSEMKFLSSSLKIRNFSPPVWKYEISLLQFENMKFLSSSLKIWNFSPTVSKYLFRNYLVQHPKFLGQESNLYFLKN